MKNRYAFEGFYGIRKPWNSGILEFWNSGILGFRIDEMWNFEGMRVWCGVTNAFRLHLIN